MIKFILILLLVTPAFGLGWLPDEDMILPEDYKDQYALLYEEWPVSRAALQEEINGIHACVRFNRLRGEAIFACGTTTIVTEHAIVCVMNHRDVLYILKLYRGRGWRVRMCPNGVGLSFIFDKGNLIEES